jgi:hypothetical protein
LQIAIGGIDHEALLWAASATPYDPVRLNFWSAIFMFLPYQKHGRTSQSNFIKSIALHAEVITVAATAANDRRQNALFYLNI